MLSQVDVDLAVLCKKIYDCIRCTVCDKGIGGRLRYTCGHTACTECASTSDCLICFSNSQAPGPVIDEVLTTKVENAANLLTAYQQLFSVNVFEKQKVTERLKIEKQVFPDCIQAPQKYQNKRKSLNNSFKGKENRIHFLGEETLIKANLGMENKVNYVKKWLADNEQIERRPFANLNINQQRTVNKKKIIPTNKITTCSKRKKSIQSNIKSKRKKNQADTSELYVKGKQNDLNVDFRTYSKKEIKNINNSETLQISLEPIVINDSQSDDIVDKDKEAWLKVLEIEKNENEHLSEESNYVGADNNRVITKAEIDDIKVPFYKKGCLKDPCRLCDESFKVNDSNITNQNEVTIVVTSSSFITTIRVSKEFHNLSKSFDKKSTAVQTDIVQTTPILNNISKSTDGDNILFPKKAHIIVKNNSGPVILSEELFSEGRPFATSNANKEVQRISNKVEGKRGCLLIEESDSDDSNFQWNHLEIKADIHKSCGEFDYGVLSVVRDEEEHARKARRPARGFTPDSSNSSEKENFHPNKPKRAKHDKKHKK